MMDSVLLSVLQRNRINKTPTYLYLYIYMWQEICYKELNHVIIKADKSQDLQGKLASFQYESHRPKTQEKLMFQFNKEGWVPKNWCFWTAGLEKTLESPLDCKEIKPVNPKGTQSWIFIGRIDTGA